VDDVTAFYPTNAKPGSEEKIQVMEMRYRLRIPLFNPLDARIDRKGRLHLANKKGIESDGADW
jgi:hypothetical protein